MTRKTGLELAVEAGMRGTSADAVDWLMFHAEKAQNSEYADHEPDAQEHLEDTPYDERFDPAVLAEGVRQGLTPGQNRNVQQLYADGGRPFCSEADVVRAAVEDDDVPFENAADLDAYAAFYDDQYPRS